MIKEKHEKGSESVKEEPGSSNKDSASNELLVKKEEDPIPSTGSNCSVKKETGRSLTKNGGIIGSTNTGSLHSNIEIKSEAEENPSNRENITSSLKSEESVDNDISSNTFGLNMQSTPQHPPSSDGVQPLVSNVINKQSSNIEVQYMQQQSQIFVFSTVLANSGANEVLQGHYPSIIAYHCAQPGTKKYLEKHPLKVTQFNRQNPNQWLNNLSIMKNKSCVRPGMGGPKTQQQSIDNFLGSDSLDDMVGLRDNDLPWEQKNHQNLDNLDSVSNGLADVVPDMNACSPSLGNVQPSLQGVKVPDENLTPQQRQHREEQLATLRKMQQILFPEDQSIEGATTEGADMNAGMMPGNPPAPIPPSGVPTSMSAQMEWQRLQSPSSGQGITAPSTGAPTTVGQSSQPPLRGSSGTPMRLQGPPPPYHQTPRSASVPIALQSPSPASPNNPTSNLSLPSPRASSALNSPADPSRQFGIRHIGTSQSPTSQDSPSAPRLNHSNPGTPLSSHMSPSVTTSNNETASSHQTTDTLFGRSLQSMVQKPASNAAVTTTSSSVNKEPNLMPVPSPQQIQYLNSFEGQELIIQKQPNTSLKEGNIISPPHLPTTIESGYPNTTEMPHSTASGPNTPTSVDVTPRFPPTPGVSSDGCRFQIPSPQTPNAPSGEKNQRLSGPGSTSTSGLSPQTCPSTVSEPMKTDIFPTPSPHLMDVPRFSGPNGSPGAKMGPFPNVPPTGKPTPLDMPNYGCARGDNVPLNPNCTSTMTGNPKVSHFDPISSLAQMSQQLTNSVASSLNGQGNQGPGMMNFGSPSMHMMDMPGCHGMGDMDQNMGNMMSMPMQGPPHGFHANSPIGPIRSLSPKLQGAFPNHMPIPRMMARPPGPNPYNGANVQVKPNAPNTIQYLPAKSQVGNPPGPPRGPPSLDFLQRFANPMNNMDSKMPSQNMQYFPNCGSNNGPMQGPSAPMGPHMGHMDGPMGSDSLGPMMGGSLGNGPSSMMGMPGGMMPMMRGPMRPPHGMIRMPQMGFNGPNGGGPPDGMFNQNPNMNNPNPQMFVNGPKGSPMGLGAPDASQPLPPSMGQNNSFKNSPFVGPTTADPNYAQQFHNFQQQLYATSTRSQMGGQAMGPGPGPPHTQQPPYFNPK